MRLFLMKFGTVFALLGLIQSSAFALSLYGPTPNKTPPKMATPSPVMSPDEFSNKVNTLNKQTNQRVAEQASASLPKQPQNPVTLPNDTTSSPSLPITNEPAQPTMPNTNPTNINPTTPTQPAPAQNQTTNTNPTVTTTPTTPQNQPYTGFGTGNTNNSTTTKPSGNSGNTGGWNINY